MREKEAPRYSHPASPINRKKERKEEGGGKESSFYFLPLCFPYQKENEGKKMQQKDSPFLPSRISLKTEKKDEMKRRRKR